MNEPIVGLSREQPWPGLMPFTEEAQEFFHGRDREVEELERLIKRETLTVLFGLSGLGKSSLLNAGLFPELRREDFHPVYLRLDLLAGASLARQALDAVVATCAAMGVEAPAPREGETLWEYFQRRDADFWSARNRLLTPVLVFDQFEEIFTLGNQQAGRAADCRDFLEQLSDLVENRVPARVAARFDAAPQLATDFDFGRRGCKVVLSFREDYLPEFEALRALMPSIMRSRLRLTRMNGLQAREAILRSGGHLVSEAVCDRIIRFVASPRASAQGADDSDLERLEVEPALLSVVCRELNNKRIRAGEPRISADLLEGGAQHEIIREFYEESLATVDRRVREFIEDQLLTEAGYRDSYALEDALRIPGVTREAIDALIAKRLLRLDERSGVLRVELTHDVLTRVAKESRDSRKQREADRRAKEAEMARRLRTRRFAVFGGAVVAGAVGLAVIFGVLLDRSNAEKRRLIETQSNVLLEQAVTQLDRNVPGEPQAVLAEALRLNPGNTAAVARMVTYMGQRTFPRPVALYGFSGGSEGGGLPIGWMEWVDSDRVAVGNDSAAALIPVVEAPPSEWPRLKEQSIALKKPEAGAAVPKTSTGTTIRSVKLLEDTKSLLVRTVAGDVLIPVPDGLGAEGLDPSLLDDDASGRRLLSPDGEWIAFTQRENVVAWNPRRHLRWALKHPSPVNTFAFSADSRSLATGCQDKNARVWDIARGSVSAGPFAHEGAVLSAAFAADGQSIITSSLDRTARVWSLKTGRQAMESLTATAAIAKARLSPDNSRAATLDFNGRLAIWRIDGSAAASDKRIAHTATMRSLREASPDGRFIALEETAPEGAVVLRVASAGTTGPQPAAPGWATAAMAGPQQAANPPQLHFSGDSTRVGIAYPDSTVEVHVSADGTRVGPRFRVDNALRLFALDHGGTRIATAGAGNVVKLWDVESGRLRGLPIQAGSVAHLAFDRTGRLLAVADLGGRIRIWDTETTLLVTSVPAGGGTRIAFIGFMPGSGELVVVDQRLVRVVALRPRAFVAKRKTFDEALEIGQVEPVERGRLMFLNSVWTAGMSTPTSRLVVGGLDGVARIVDLDALRLAGAAMKHDGVVLGADFAADGRWIVTRTENGARVWDGRTGYAVSDEMRRPGRLSNAALVAGGATLVSQSADEAMRSDPVDLDFPLPYASWLPQLVEASGGSRIDKSGSVAPLENPRDEFAQVKASLEHDAAQQWWQSWGQSILKRFGAPMQKGEAP